MSTFTVELPLFSGPFRLLAELILDQKMDVCDVPVARITDLYLRRGRADLDEWDLEEASWFLAVCATLLELKVGRLLPRPGAVTEEDLLEGVSPDLLYARSLELMAFRRVATLLGERMEEAARMVPRGVGVPKEFAHLYPDPMETVGVADLQEAAARLLAAPNALDLSHVAPIRVTLAEAMDAVQRGLAARDRALFRDLVEHCEERIEVVVRFLALLELYREGKVELSQAGLFGDIEVRWRGATAGEERLGRRERA